MKNFWGIKICLYLPLNTKIRLTLLCLSGFELYSRWVPLTLLLWCLAKTGSTYRTKQFRLQIPQFIMALDDKYDPFAYHSVIHMSPQTQTEGVSGTSQSYLSFRASQNSLLFKLDAPFWVARSTAVSSQSFSRNRALHLIKVFLPSFILSCSSLGASHVAQHLQSAYFIVV